MKFSIGEWIWHKGFYQAGLIVESKKIWKQDLYKVYFPKSESVIQVSFSELLPLREADLPGKENLTFVAASAKIKDSVACNALIAPIEANVIPLPHQLYCLSRAVSKDKIRYLLADEVGLGKTIEAGLIIQELKMRGLVNRVLVVVPSGLMNQWKSEMMSHFNEDFKIVTPSSIAAYREFIGDTNPWSFQNQVIVSQDSIKPLDYRKGWTREKIAKYNKDRFEDLIGANWDLVVIDEAHRLAGSTEQVARFKLGQGLADASPYMLLLTATPHQGKTDAFLRLMSMLDEDEFIDKTEIDREVVTKYVICSEKRVAIDTKGEKLFKKRFTHLTPIKWKTEQELQRLLYFKVTEYVKKGYNKALLNKKPHVGFLMLLYQRLVVSSSAAVCTTLSKRLHVLKQLEEQIHNVGEPAEIDNLLENLGVDLDLYDLEGLSPEEQLEVLVVSSVDALDGEIKEIEDLVSIARQCMAMANDAKTEHLIHQLNDLEREQDSLKVLIFTEFVGTQSMLREKLELIGYKVVIINGSMDLEARSLAQYAFAHTAQILISTDAGGEGLNLQFCHTVINYDLPWNPMKIEQRIGRVDRIGQLKDVHAYNYVIEDTVEFRIRQVLEEKLKIIMLQFGVDKAGDVLDSGEASEMFDEAFKEAIINADQAEKIVDSVLLDFKAKAKLNVDSRDILHQEVELDAAAAQELMAHPVHNWLRSLVLSYLRSSGGEYEAKLGFFNLEWPDGQTTENVVFTKEEYIKNPSARLLSLEESRIQGLLVRQNFQSWQQPIPAVKFTNLGFEVDGTWSIWRISLNTTTGSKERFMPLYLDQNMNAFQPTANAIWDELIHFPGNFEVIKNIEPPEAEALQIAAEDMGRDCFTGLLNEHHEFLEAERKKCEMAFRARKRAIDRLGLPEVREYRLKQLILEQEKWIGDFANEQKATPDLQLVLLIKVVS